MITKTRNPRDSEVIVVEVNCHCNEELLGEWDSLSEESKEYWRNSIVPIPCEGAGGTGLHCIRCPFGEHEVID